MRISDWSSDVCSSDLLPSPVPGCRRTRRHPFMRGAGLSESPRRLDHMLDGEAEVRHQVIDRSAGAEGIDTDHGAVQAHVLAPEVGDASLDRDAPAAGVGQHRRSEEHTSELQSLMRISYAVFCLKKK